VPHHSNVQSMIEVADISEPTDRPHLAAFILPSAVGYSLLCPSNAPTYVELRRPATKYDCDHLVQTSSNRRTNSTAARGTRAGALVLGRSFDGLTST
jgi:hypothetical protein